MNRKMWIAAAAGGLAALAGLWSCTSREATNRIDQEADGCGAWRYRGSANIDCRYQGKMIVGHGDYTTGSCINDSQVSCSYDVACEWEVSATTACVSGAPDCMSVYPPEGSLSNPGAVTLDLTPGSLLCDVPGGGPPNPALLKIFCNQHWGTVAAQLRAQCESQTDRNVGGATCCLNCNQPSPVAGVAGGELGGVTYGCSAEDN